MDPALVGRLLEQGVTTLIAVGSFLWIIREQQRRLDRITYLLTRLLAELGVHDTGGV